MMHPVLRRRIQWPSSQSFSHRFSTAVPRKSNTLRYIGNFSVVASLSLAAYTYGALYPHRYLTFIAPRAAPGPPADPDAPSSIAYTTALEEQLQSLPRVKAMRADPHADEWYEARPYRKVPEERRVNNLTAGALKGPGKLAIPPLVFCKKDESEAVIFVHVGRGLCGHDGIIHGGLLATILDESLARTAINNLPDKIGVTANLSIDYRAPTFADQFIVLKISLLEKKGRKTKVTGKVEDLNGTLLVQATATFVQPRYAHLLSNTAIKQAMGEPEPTKSTPVLMADGTQLPKSS